MPRMLVVTLPSGETPVLEQVLAADEHQLQEQMRLHPELLPLDELGLTAPAIVVGRESSLNSGRVDLVLLGNGGDLAVIEFKTGPTNPDFRECLAQLLDYGSDLWGMSVDQFDELVARPYFNGTHCPPSQKPTPATLEGAIASSWPANTDDAIGWRDRLEAQLRDGSFRYVAVAQRFTAGLLRTLEYLNATMTGAQFSAVELIRFAGSSEVGAFEARFVAGATPTRSASALKAAKTALAGVDDLLGQVTDDAYRHALADLFNALSTIDELFVFWGTTGCSLRVSIPNRQPLSIGWIFPPGPPRWMGLTDVTLGWYEDANGVSLPDDAREALHEYSRAVIQLPGATNPKPSAVTGATLPHDLLSEDVAGVVAAIRAVVVGLVAATGP